VSDQCSTPMSCQAGTCPLSPPSLPGTGHGEASSRLSLPTAQPTHSIHHVRMYVHSSIATSSTSRRFLSSRLPFVKQTPLSCKHAFMRACYSRHSFRSSSPLLSSPLLNNPLLAPQQRIFAVLPQLCTCWLESRRVGLAASLLATDPSLPLLRHIRRTWRTTYPYPLLRRENPKKHNKILY